MAVFVLRLECRYLESLGLSSEPFLLENFGKGALEGFVVVGSEVESEKVVGIEGGVARGAEEEVLGVEDALGFGSRGGFG